MFLRLKYLLNSKQINNFSICSSVQTINSMPFSRLSRYSLSSIRVKLISLNYFTGHTKKVIYVFQGNWDYFDMIFITVIQPNIHKSNRFLE